MGVAKRFKQLIERKELLVMPGAHDAFSARIIAAQGFEALLAPGSAATGTLLAEPDTGQLSMRDYADHYGRITAATDLPVLADADTGFGGVNNVRHTVRAFERAGVAALFIEDQVFPKRCGYFEGKAVVAAEEMVAKIKAALDARHDPDFIIMARTDALGVFGLEAAIERACLYREAGADMTFVQGADRAADLARICREVPCPQLANVSQASRLATALSRAELQDSGAAAVTFPIVALLAAARAMTQAMAALHRDGSYEAVQDELMDFGSYAALVGLEKQRAREEGYIAAAKALAARKPNRNR